MATNEELQQQLDALRQEMGQLRGQLSTAQQPAAGHAGLSRRTLLRAAPVAAVAGAVAALSASPAAAAVGDPVLLGKDNTATGATTSITGGDTTSGAPAVNVTGGLNVDAFTSGGPYIEGVEINPFVGTGPVLHAHSLEGRYAAEFSGYVAPYLNASGHDVVHVTTEGPGAAIVVEVDDHTTFNYDGSPGILEPGVGVRVHAEAGPAFDAVVTGGTALSAVCSSTTSANDAVTVDYSGTGRALYAQSHNPTNINGTVTGVNEGHGIGVWGEQRNTTGPGIGVVGVGGVQGRGAQFTGGAAAARFVPSTATSHPTTGKTGDVFVDSVVRLWFCQKASTTSTPAVWKQLA